MRYNDFGFLTCNGFKVASSGLLNLKSTAKELLALIEREKDDFISIEEYAKRRGISL
jgi:hypothetical protein